MARRLKPVVIGGFRGAAARPEPGGPWMQPTQERGPYLKAAVNVQVTEEFDLVSLPVPEVLSTASGALGALADAPAGLLVQERAAGTLTLRPAGANPVTLVSGLPDAPVVTCEHQGLVYWWCGVLRGRITPLGTPLPWALPQTPTPTVQVIAGQFPAGRYLVAATWLDSTGAESGCAPSVAVELPASSGLRVSVSAFPAGAAAVRLYVSPPNGRHPAWIEDRPVLGDFPVDVTRPILDADLGAQVVLRTQGLLPLPVGDGMTTRGPFLLVWADNLLAFSAGDWSHLYDPARHLFVLPAPILGAVGLDTGVWVVTQRGVFFIDGADLTAAGLSPRVGPRAYAAGGARVPPDYAGVESARDVAAFASDEGLVFGTADGVLLAPAAHRQTQAWDVAGKTADIRPCVVRGQRTLAVNLA